MTIVKVTTGDGQEFQVCEKMINDSSLIKNQLSFYENPPDEIKLEVWSRFNTPQIEQLLEFYKKLPSTGSEAIKQSLKATNETKRFQMLEPANYFGLKTLREVLLESAQLFLKSETTSEIRKVVEA